MKKVMKVNVECNSLWEACGYLGAAISNSAAISLGIVGDFDCSEHLSNFFPAHKEPHMFIKRFDESKWHKMYVAYHTYRKAEMISMGWETQYQEVDSPISYQSMTSFRLTTKLRKKFMPQYYYPYTFSKEPVVDFYITDEAYMPLVNILGKSIDDYKVKTFEKASDIVPLTKGSSFIIAPAGHPIIAVVNGMYTANDSSSKGLPMVITVVPRDIDSNREMLIRTGIVWEGSFILDDSFLSEGISESLENQLLSLASSWEKMCSYDHDPHEYIRDIVRSRKVVLSSIEAN